MPNGFVPMFHNWASKLDPDIGLFGESNIQDFVWVSWLLPFRVNLCLYTIVLCSECSPEPYNSGVKAILGNIVNVSEANQTVDFHRQV